MAKYVLGKKQTSRNEDFVKAWNNIEQLISREEAERLVADAVSDIIAKTAGKTLLMRGAVARTVSPCKWSVNGQASTSACYAPLQRLNTPALWIGAGNTPRKVLPSWIIRNSTSSMLQSIPICCSRQNPSMQRNGSTFCNTQDKQSISRSSIWT